MSELKLDTIPASLSISLDEDFTKNMVKNCVFLLSELQHKTGVSLSPYISKSNLMKSPVPIVWELKVTSQMRNTFQDANRTVDYAAMCIAVGLVSPLLRYQFITVAKADSGTDFWLTNDEMGILLEAKLEVSGIKKANTNNSIAKRLRDKKGQVAKNNKGELPHFIAIIEFSKPACIFVKYGDDIK